MDMCKWVPEPAEAGGVNTLKLLTRLTVNPDSYELPDASAGSWSPVLEEQ